MQNTDALQQLYWYSINHLHLFSVFCCLTKTHCRHVALMRIRLHFLKTLKPKNLSLPSFERVILNFKAELIAFECLDEYLWSFKEQVLYWVWPVDLLDRFVELLWWSNIIYIKITSFLLVLWLAGKRMWRYTGSVLDPGFPRQISELGLPRHPDCAFYYAPLGHMVVFKGSRYSVLNLKTLCQEPYYPRRLTDWTGVPQGTNGALTRPDGRLYLFREQRFWRFDPVKVRITKEGLWAKDLSWTGCSNAPESNNLLWPAEGAISLDKVQFVGVSCNIKVLSLNPQSLYVTDWA